MIVSRNESSGDRIRLIALRKWRRFWETGGASSCVSFGLLLCRTPRDLLFHEELQEEKQPRDIDRVSPGDSALNLAECGLLAMGITDFHSGSI